MGTVRTISSCDALCSASDHRNKERSRPIFLARRPFNRPYPGSSRTSRSPHQHPGPYANSKRSDLLLPTPILAHLPSTAFRLPTSPFRAPRIPGRKRLRNKPALGSGTTRTARRRPATIDMAAQNTNPDAPAIATAVAREGANVRSGSIALPELRAIAMESLDPADVPALRIKTDDDVRAWTRTRGYQDYGLFLRRLAESVVGHMLPHDVPAPDQGVAGVIALLDKLDGWIDEIPPLPTPQRFGNLAFRSWGKRLEEESTALLRALLPARLRAAVPFIEPYWLTSFGSFVRMDYGSGHETSFALFLLCLTLLRFLSPAPHVERQVVLDLFVRYLRLCWRLQDVYRLEPAGSHGVWGLDDYNFLSYVFGSAQLRDQQEIAVDAVLRPPLPPTNLYFMSIMRIREVKSGPFHEHSSQLHSIATGVQHWHKVHSGLFKMYEAEVLGKRVVVQHIPLGGLLPWDVPQHQPQSRPQAQHHPSLSSTPAAPLIQDTVAPWVHPPNAPITTTYAPPRWIAPGPGRPHTTHPAGVAPGPIVAGRMPLGPAASTASRPSPGIAPTTMAPPPPPPPSPHTARHASHDSSSTREPRS